MKEAAELMNTSAKAVESLLSRARGRLRTMLKGYYDEHK
jgi:DNA-directed RNA polymerase specialized sigma24 family protein